MTALGIHDLLHDLLPDGGDPVDDATFKAIIEQTIQDEQAFVDAQLAEGRNLIVNTIKGNKRVIHRAGCPSVSRCLDRSASWFRGGGDLTELRRDMRQGGFSPKMPKLATEAELDVLKSYRVCLSCQPGLKRAEKIYVASKTSSVKNLTERHIGRTFTAEGLKGPFILVKIEHTITAEGKSTVLHGETGPLAIAVDGRVLMLPVNETKGRPLDGFGSE